MKNPNFAEASEQFRSLAVEKKKEGDNVFAAYCLTASSK